ncbi:MAG: MarC family protein [Ignavibacteriaceae bacterium]|jgi:multiple antibiotic resistance protein|nr:MarC family protein [Ignavibacteriaceae bacterium]
MNSLFEFGLLAFTSFFTMINPIGVIPVYASLTAKMTQKEAHNVALKAVLTALLIMLFFAFTGQLVFNFFHISIHSLRVVGGIIFFMAGYDMLQAKLIRTKDEEKSTVEFAKDIAITPLAIPLICGPGAITISIVLMRDAVDYEHKAILFFVMILVMVVTLLFLWGARKVLNFLGENGNKVLMRIMGLIVMVIAIEFFFAGLTPLVRNMLKIE